MNATAAKVSIVVVHANDDPALLRATLDAAAESETMDFAEVVVVDDASREPRRPDVKSKRGLQLLAMETPIGFAAAANRAAAAARGTYLLFLRPGVEAPADALHALVAAMDRDTRLAAAAPTIHGRELDTAFDPARPFTSALSRIVQMARRRRPKISNAGPQQVVPVEWAGESALMVRASLFRAACGFDEAFERVGAEEDWCWRQRRRGYHVAVVGAAGVRDRFLAARMERAWITTAGHRAALRLIGRRSGAAAVLRYRLAMSLALLARGAVTLVSGKRRGTRTRALVRCLWGNPTGARA